MTAQVKTRKKLIEVALPLEAINAASAREKSIRHGHPSTLHLWWARRPLAAARAVIFSQLVDDPSAVPEEFPTEEAQNKERKRLFKLIEKLVLWENTTNETVLEEARAEILRSWRRACADNKDHPQADELFNPDKLPAFHDPFAGGGALPLEAQRLGLEAWASDLNPVAVLINKAMIEIPPKFAGLPPVNPEARRDRMKLEGTWSGAQGLAEDVRYYGKWMRDEAEKRIGHLYPKVEITAEMVHERPDLKPYLGQKLTVIAWLWARTVKSPNPAFADVDVPLASTFILSTKAGKEAYVEPVIEGKGYRFRVKIGKPENMEAMKNGTKLSRGASFRCLMSNVPMTEDYIRGEFKAKRHGERLMAIVAEGARGRVYIPPIDKHVIIAKGAKPAWRPEEEMNTKTSNLVSGRGYGITHWYEIFTPRQLVALTTFSDLVTEAREKVKQDALAAGITDDSRGLDAAGTGATAYADAVAVYLASSLSKLADYNSSMCSWISGGQTMRNTYGRQAIPMVWDFAEANPFSESTGSLLSCIEQIYRVLAVLNNRTKGYSQQIDAQKQILTRKKFASTDPPYYDNIGYADLSDFFYIWLRRSIKLIFPELFATLTVPKTEELVATPYRHNSKKEAEYFFLDGMTSAMSQLSQQVHPSAPVTIYYAFKQAEQKDDGGIASTGWATFLEAVIKSGFSVCGTWPVRTEMGNRQIAWETNALASSIVIVCRPRQVGAATITRREFLELLKDELPPALHKLQQSSIAPVDLQQAILGPGMAVYTRYASILDSEGNKLSVGGAISLILQIMDEVLAEQEGDFDADTRWALIWFEQYGFQEAEYGIAETLSKSKNTSVAGMVSAGILQAQHGRVRLLRPAELPPDWDPATDKRLTVWEIVHHLIRALDTGETVAAELLDTLGVRAETARELAYRLFTVCERRKRSADAQAYNSLIQSWPEITRLAGELQRTQGRQGKFQV